MNEISWSFSLGKIGVLEKTLIPSSLLAEILNLSLEQALERVKDYFFIPETSRIESWAWEEKFLAQESYLEEVCQDLVKEEELKDCLKNFSCPQKLEDKVRKYKNVQAKEFVEFYFNLLNTINFLRIQFYGLKPGYWAVNDKELIRNLERKSFFLYGDQLKNFYFQGEDILKKEKNFLLHFLLHKYIVKFWERWKEQTLLGGAVVCWYFFAKKLNLDTLKFCLVAVAYDLDRDNPKEVLNLVYG